MGRIRSSGAQLLPRKKTVENVFEQTLRIIKTGILNYGDAWHLQKELRKARMEGKIGDTLLLLQHPPTITLGKGGKEENLRVEEKELIKLGIQLYFTDRGGDITYHGPGQMVGYPILCLRDHGLSAGNYVRSLEEVISITLKELGIIAKKMPHLIGLWVGGKKIASLGVRISRGITTHGFALNVNNDLTPFQFIYPCGMRGMEVTSLKEVLEEEVDYAFIEKRIAINFSRMFQMKIKETSDLKYNFL